MSHTVVRAMARPDDADVEACFPWAATRKEALELKQALEKFTVNLNEEAAEGLIDPAIGRDKNWSENDVLSRRRKTSIFVGEAGAGKTAVAKGSHALSIAVMSQPRSINRILWMWAR